MKIKPINIETISDSEAIRVIRCIAESSLPHEEGRNCGLSMIVRNILRADNSFGKDINKLSQLIGVGTDKILEDCASLFLSLGIYNELTQPLSDKRRYTHAFGECGKLSKERLMELARSRDYEDRCAAIKYGYLDEKLLKDKTPAVMSALIRKNVFNKEQLTHILATYGKNACIRCAMFEIGFEREYIFESSKRSFTVMLKAYELGYKKDIIRKISTKWLREETAYVDILDKYGLR